MCDNGIQNVIVEVREKYARSKTEKPVVHVFCSFSCSKFDFYASLKRRISIDVFNALFPRIQGFHSGEVNCKLTGM